MGSYRDKEVVGVFIAFFVFLRINFSLKLKQYFATLTRKESYLVTRRDYFLVFEVV
jgi:hypothetical protein